MAINPSNHSTLYTANAQGCKAHTVSNTVFTNLLSQLTSFLVFKILLKACPSAGCLPSLERQGEGRETYQDPPMAPRTEFSQQPREGCTRVIPIYS